MKDQQNLFPSKAANYKLLNLDQNDLDKTPDEFKIMIIIMIGQIQGFQYFPRKCKQLDKRMKSIYNVIVSYCNSTQ